MISPTIIMPSPKQLCGSYNPLQKQKPAYVLQGSDREYTYSLRRFQIPNDLVLVYKWLERNRFREFHFSRKQITATYQDVAQSTFAQSYTGLINGNPRWQVDIYDALFDRISDDMPVMPGDYIIRLIVSPEIHGIHNSFKNLVQCSLTWFFRFPQVSRVLIEIPGEHVKDESLIREAGFELVKQLDNETAGVNIYDCTAWQFCRSRGVADRLMG